MAEESSRTTRTRKQVERFAADDEEKVEKNDKIVIPEGTGMALGDVKVFEVKSKKAKGDDDSIKNMHKFLFGKVGSSNKRKANLKKWTGFPEAEIEEQKEELKEKLLKLKGSEIQDMLDLFELEVSGTKDVQAERLTDYLAVPSDRGEPKPATRKRKAAGSPSKKQEAKKTKRAKKEKDPNAPKRALTAYMLFANERRPVLLKEDPDLRVPQAGKLLGAEWQALDAKSKKKYEDLAKKEKERYARECEERGYNPSEKKKAAESKPKKAAKKKVESEDEEEKEEEHDEEEEEEEGGNDHDDDDEEEEEEDDE